MGIFTYDQGLIVEVCDEPGLGRLIELPLPRGRRPGPGLCGLGGLGCGRGGSGGPALEVAGGIGATHVLGCLLLLLLLGPLHLGLAVARSTASGGDVAAG